jgi:hypothetical protein
VKVGRIQTKKIQNSRFILPNGQFSLGLINWHFRQVQIGLGIFFKMNSPNLSLFQKFDDQDQEAQVQKK